MAAIEQGVLVVEAYANSEREVGKAIQEAVSKAIIQLNQEGKRVVNITAGPSVKYVLGVNHLTHILWESAPTSNVESMASVSEAATTKQSSMHHTNMKEQKADKSDLEVGPYDVIMTKCGTPKNFVILDIRMLLDLSYEDASGLLAQSPTRIVHGVSKNFAETIKNKLEARGCKIEIKEN